MPKIKYRDLRFQAKAQAKIVHANRIIEEYQAQGYTITLRQLFYQFVSRDLIANTPREYANLGDTIARGRFAGLIDWSAIIDRTRNLQRLPSWDDPTAAVETIHEQYMEDLWFDQRQRVEVWIEKDALLGVVMDTCDALRVPYFSCRGYVSQSEMWSAAVRIINRYQMQSRTSTFRQHTTILHLGDHDPSGLDMTRYIDVQLGEFCAAHGAEPPTVRRIGLTIDQVRHYNPPPNAAKQEDPRFADYLAEFGPESWELDALPPDVLNTLISDNIAKWVDDKRWKKASEEELANKRTLRRIRDRMDEVEFMVNDGVEDDEEDAGDLEEA